MIAEEMELRPFSREEYHAFYADYVPDPMMSSEPFHYCRSYADRCFDLERQRQSWYPVFGIFLSSGECIGALSLKYVDSSEKVCEIGIILRDDTCKNRGYGTMAMRQGIALARERYGMQAIYANTADGNVRMQHVLDKLGFRRSASHGISLGFLPEEELLHYVLK